MEKKQIILSLMGKPGSGKDSFFQILTELFPEERIANIRFSDPLKDACLELGLEPNRDNLSLMARVWKKIISPSALADAIKTKLDSHKDERFVCLNGVRWEADVNLTTEVGGHLLFIAVDPRRRWERIRQRGEKPGEMELSFEQFLAQEQTENDLLMDTLKSRAEISINNDGSYDDFKNSVHAYLKTIL